MSLGADKGLHDSSYARGLSIPSLLETSYRAFLSFPVGGFRRHVEELLLIFA